MNLKDVRILGNIVNTTPGKFFYSEQLVDYKLAVNEMHAYVGQIASHSNPECVWFLEHTDVYTGGTSASENDVLDKAIPYVATNRGGQVTYHGPGQLIAYVMIDLKRRSVDLRAYVSALEEWIQAVLREFNIHTFTDRERVGVWTTDDHGESKKIAAIGVRVSRGITWHGVALNIAPQLSKYQGIVPCGIQDAGVTSLHQLGQNTTTTCVMDRMAQAFLHNDFLRFR